MFFDPNSFGEAKITMDHFKEWAGSIASSYLNSGILPTEELAKIAQAEELTPHHVEVLAAETNKLIHQTKYASAENKYHAADFPLADARAVIAKLQTDGGQLKIAVEMPDPIIEDKGPDVFEMFGVTQEMFDKNASARSGVELKGHLKMAGSRTALLAQKLQDQKILTKYAAEGAEKKFLKQARQMILQGDNAGERMSILADIHHFVQMSDMEDLANKPLAKLAYVLGKEGLVEPWQSKEAMTYFMKTADMKAPQSLISDSIKARVINGNHPLYITLKTFKDTSAALDLSTDRHQLVDDRLKTIHQKIRAL